MNVVALVLWVLQRRADRQFLGALETGLPARAGLRTRVT
jgi:hypothetical protein